MHAIDLLIADHNRVRGLFTRFRSAKDAEDATTMVELAGKVFDELDVHTKIEEEIFYPAAREASDEVADVVEEGEQEHHVAKVLMAELGQSPATSDEWVAKMTVLIENVEHHAEEEETSMFPKLRSQMAADRLQSLADRMEARKAELGAPVLADKIDLTKEELTQLAQDQEIPGRSTMSKEELAATVAPS